MLPEKGVEARQSGFTKIKMWGVKLEQIDMLFTIPESWAVVDSVF